MQVLPDDNMNMINPQHLENPQCTNTTSPNIVYHALVRQSIFQQQDHAKHHMEVVGCKLQPSSPIPGADPSLSTRLRCDIAMKRCISPSLQGGQCLGTVVDTARNLVLRGPCAFRHRRILNVEECALLHKAKLQWTYETFGSPSPVDEVETGIECVGTLLEYGRV